MQIDIFINNDWYFVKEFTEDFCSKEYDITKAELVRIPHNVEDMPFNYFDENIYQMVSGYRKVLIPDESWKGKKIILTFEGVAHGSEVYLNGEKIAEHHCGYTAFSVALEDKLRYGEENILAVKVDSRETQNIPPFGFVIDYMTYGGIYRDVYISISEPTYMEDVFVNAYPCKEEGREKDGRIVSEFSVCGINDGMSIKQYIRMKGEGAYHLLVEKELKETDTSFIIKGKVKNVSKWTPETPVLYDIKNELCRNGEVVYIKHVTTGFRKAEFKADGFYLNGVKYKIRGLNRHQAYPYVGYAMPQSVQENDADILKKELGLNAVRTSHYPQSHYFLDRCDEIGLLVFTEMPGWQHIGDEEWKEQAVANVRDMVLQYRNHPSIILWGVRINESADDDEFYVRTNEEARALDGSRATGGVRCIKKSSLLEDVYTYNDFSHDGKRPGCESKRAVTSDMGKAYLISEYNGHMYPTKNYDCEDHRRNHALRHAEVLDTVAGQEDIAGSFGWCMADYNTHKDFGSGDRVCYHGVLDMFRNHKFAASVYAAQQEGMPVLALSSSMDIGEHPGCNRDDTYIITNADSVRMYKNDVFIKEYWKASSKYSNMTHGPILIDDFIGDTLKDGEGFSEEQAELIKKVLNPMARFGAANLPRSCYLPMAKLRTIYHMRLSDMTPLYNKYVGDWGGESTTYRFDAIKEDNVVASIVKEPMKKVHLEAIADRYRLVDMNTYDVACVRIRALDENGNVLSFFNEPVFLEIDGPGKLIGPSVISLKGGMGGTYIKTIEKAGSISLTIKADQSEEVKLWFRAVCY